MPRILIANYAIETVKPTSNNFLFSESGRICRF
jgi:hypothetical protein